MEPIVKWSAASIQIFGYLMLTLGFVDVVPYIFTIGVSLWLLCGFLWKEAAIIIVHVVGLAVLLYGVLT